MHADSHEHIVVLSPHLDDAILSLGSWVAASGRSASVRVVSVLAGDPLMDRAASSWDLRCGFDNQLEATEARRREDARACEIVGVEPVWLPFANGVYGLPDVELAWAALVPHLEWADMVLAPGCPLRHPDHKWLTTLLLERLPVALDLGLYLEQPYAARQRLNEFKLPSTSSRFEGAFIPSIVPYGRDQAAIKRRAVRSYASQLRPLSRRFPFVVSRLLRYESSRGGETIAWLNRDAGEDPTSVGNSRTRAATGSRSARSLTGEEK
jgi:LmbE family N-acetylglucosaminyl deacetylase